MRGAIHGIWLVKNDTQLHPAVITNLASWEPDAAESGFQVVLWTNAKNFTPEEQLTLEKSNIKVIDPIECKNSPLYKYYEFFFLKGVDGDTTAFALASDILRMAILDFTANDKYFIYADPNDVKLVDLKNNLSNLDLFVKNNKLGFSFPVGPVATKTNVFDIRNDVLIAYKAKNTKFFKDYLTAYWTNLEDTYQRYEKPTTDSQAKLLASRISNETSTLFFRLENAKDGSIKIQTQFGDYSDNWQIINSGTYLNYLRIIEDGNTWLPISDSHDAQEELDINDIFLKGLTEEIKTAKLQTTTKKIYSAITEVKKYTVMAGFTTVFFALILVTIFYKISKNKLSKII